MQLSGVVELSYLYLYLFTFWWEGALGLENLMFFFLCINGLKIQIGENKRFSVLNFRFVIT